MHYSARLLNLAGRYISFPGACVAYRIVVGSRILSERNMSNSGSREQRRRVSSSQKNSVGGWYYGCVSAERHMCVVLYVWNTAQEDRDLECCRIDAQLLFYEMLNQEPSMVR